MSTVASMTGFATAAGRLAGDRSFSLAIKSVNHRHLDLVVRLPDGLDALETNVRQAVKSEIRRGHVELTLVIEKAPGGAWAIEVNEGLLDAYVHAFKDAAQRLHLNQEPDLNGLLKMPGVVAASVPALKTAELEGPVLTAVQALLERFQAARRAEGSALTEELRASMHRVAALVEEARGLRAGVALEEYTKLSARLTEMLGGAGVAQDRVLTEAALLAGRSEVEEELVRLVTHLDRFVALLEGGGEVGRQLDFLLQELNRETNTLLSKTGANSGRGGLRLTEIGLAVKMELERAREQVQNLE